MRALFQPFSTRQAAFCLTVRLNTGHKKAVLFNWSIKYIHWVGQTKVSVLQKLCLVDFAGYGDGGAAEDVGDLCFA